jgi:uncharacterized protein YndB with AHSA1/START domain
LLTAREQQVGRTAYTETAQSATKEQQMTSNEGGGDRILGSLRSADGKGVVHMEDRFDTDVDDLWRALTDPGRLARWQGEVEGDLRVGGEFSARWFSSRWEGTGRIEACEPPQRLLLTMRDADPQPGQAEETVIEATLTTDGGQTILVVEERGMPLELVAAYGAGVQIHVEDLAAHLAGREHGDWGARFDELFPAYQALAADVG